MLATSLSLAYPYSPQAFGKSSEKGATGFLSSASYMDKLSGDTHNSAKISTKSLPLLSQVTLLSYSIPLSAPELALKDTRKPITYIVKKGDTPSKIAENFNISLATLLWANKLTTKSYIRPGQKLEILPVSGIKHTVRKGETILTIARKYKTEADKIIEFNNLPADAFIKVGQQLIIPDGKMPAPTPRRRSTSFAVYSKSRLRGPGTGRSHNFPYGQCTWYVAQKRYVPWSGNAKSWVANARARGFPTCVGSKCMPKVGAIVSLGGNSWLTRRYGHVAYVEKISGNRFLISEMNHTGWAKVSWRWFPIGSPAIRGFIY